MPLGKYFQKKIFSAKSYDIANECDLIFNCSVSNIVYNKAKFLSKLKYSSDIVVMLYVYIYYFLLYCITIFGE